MHYFNNILWHAQLSPNGKELLSNSFSFFLSIKLLKSRTRIESPLRRSSIKRTMKEIKKKKKERKGIVEMNSCDLRHSHVRKNYIIPTLLSFSMVNRRVRLK